MSAYTWWANEMQHGTCETKEQAQTALAIAIGRDLHDLYTADGGADETYYYDTAEQRDADDTGAYAWAIYPAENRASV